MQSKADKRGRATIPRALRGQLDIRDGTTINFTSEDGRLIAIKAGTEDPLDSLYGKYCKGRSTDAIMNALRGKP